MKIGEWIGLGGVVTLLIVLALALSPLEARRIASATGGGDGAAGAAVSLLVPQPGFIGPLPATGNGSSPLAGVGGAINVAARAVVPDTAPPATTTAAEGSVLAQPGLMPFEQAPMVRFDGTIQQITELPQQDQQVHIWVHEPGGRESHISVGPQWFLSYMGCTLTHDMRVSGKGFRFDRTRLDPDPVIYAKQLFVNNRWCQLRNDEGFALWSNQLR
ncbi:MAG: hypothetical protein HQL66_04635 [Magnetococcales bacterium]|nr:hypothetical protein [Magnetococcales bacterium]